MTGRVVSTMVIAIPSASTVQGVARTAREGDRVERAAVNSELDHPPERGVPHFDVMTVAMTTITEVDRTRARSYSLADMSASSRVQTRSSHFRSPDPIPRDLTQA